jgi:hypothetical protein
MTQTFSPSEAALSVFELSKRQPQFVLRFCILYAVVMIVTYALAGALGVGDALNKFVALTQTNPQPDPEAVMEILAPATTGIAVLLIFGLISGLLLSTMGLRKAVRDEDAGLFGLQVGADEARLFAALLLVWAILIGVSLAISIIGGIATLGNVKMVALTLTASIIAMTIVGVRLSQYAVLSIAEKSVAVVKSWHETKGQMWRFIGAYLLWFLISLVFSMIVQTIGSLVGGLMGSNVGTGMPATLSEFMKPGWLFYALTYGLCAGFQNLGAICVGAYAWHQMRGNLPMAVDQAF